MFDWLFEGRIEVYVVLAAVVLVFLAAWWRFRDRWLLIVAGVSAFLVLLYLALQLTVETPRKAARKQIKARLEEMAGAAKRGDAEGILKYVSDKFRSKNGADKTVLSTFVRQYVSARPDIVLDKFEFVEEPTDGKAVIRFRATLNNNQVGFCEATFDYDEKEGWRLRGFRMFELPNSKNELPLPF
jgi:hypothetical protein